MQVAFTWDTLIDKLFPRSSTYETCMVIFSFLNKNKGVWVTVNCVSTSKQLAMYYLTFGFSPRIHLQ